jgi:hypothetical protein
VGEHLNVNVSLNAEAATALRPQHRGRRDFGRRIPGTEIAETGAA